nr:hypothetical protein [Tanacetum cinerariifolium]
VGRRLCDEGEPRQLWLKEEVNGDGWIRMTTTAKTGQRIDASSSPKAFDPIMVPVRVRGHLNIDSLFVSVFINFNQQKKYTKMFQEFMCHFSVKDELFDMEAVSKIFEVDIDIVNEEGCNLKHSVPEILVTHDDSSILQIVNETIPTLQKLKETRKIRNYNPNEGRGSKKPVTKEVAIEELLEFVDDVEFWFPPGKKPLVQYRSASRIGLGFDANKKRVKHAQPEDTNELFQKLLEDLQIIIEELSEYINSPSWNYPTFYDDDEEHSVQYQEYLEKSLVHTIAPILSTEELEYSLSMGYKHLNTTSEMKSNKIIKSGVKNFVPIPIECEVTSEDKRECVVLVYAFDDIEYVEASLSVPKLVSLEEENDVHQEDEEFNLDDIQDVVLHEKLFSINHLIANIEYLNDNPTPDYVLMSFASFPIFEESDNFLLDNSSPEFETFSDQMEKTKSEVDLFLASDNSIPPGIENFDYNSEGDIHFLEHLLIEDFISFPENESSDSDHHDDPSFPRPPPKPPDVEFFFDSKPDVIVEEISNKLNKDECFNPGGEIDVSTNIEDDDYFPFIFVIRIFLPYLIYPEVFPLLLSAERFNPSMIEVSRVRIVVPVHKSFTSFICN